MVKKNIKKKSNANTVKYTIEGNPEAWDNIWDIKNKTNDLYKELFTKRSPKSLLQFWQKCYFEDLWALIKQKDYNRFLELGSGRGTTSMYLSFHGKEDITMVDLSETAFEIAKENFEKNDFKIPAFVIADVCKTKLSEAKYDCIYNIGLLEHFVDPEPVLKEAFRLLKPGGMIFMVIVPTVPYLRSIVVRLLFNPFSVVKHFLREIFIKKRSNDMVRTEYYGGVYKKILQDLGAVSIECIPYNPYFKVHDTPFIESNFSLPIYKLCYSFKKRFWQKPYMKTSSFFASCYLLICYKSTTQ